MTCASISRTGAARHALEEADEVAAVLSGTQLARDRQLGVDALDVLERLCLEVEDGGVLAGVRDLEDPVADHEGLVALAPEVARLALEAEELGGDRGDLLHGEARRIRLEDALRPGRDHGLILRRANPGRASHTMAEEMPRDDI